MTDDQFKQLMQAQITQIALLQHIAANIWLMAAKAGTANPGPNFQKADELLRKAPMP